MPDADLSLAVPAVFFGSVGTAGQRCTSTRRLYLHRSIAPDFLSRLQKLYASPALRPGDPLDARTLLGPLHSRAALDVYDGAIKDLKAAGAQILVAGDRESGRSKTGDGAGGAGRYDSLEPPLDRGNFVRPTIAIPRKHPKSLAKFPSKNAAANADAAPVEAPADHGDRLWAKERFAPVLLVAEFDELEEAIAWNNAVPQGLSSSLWTRDVRHVGKWIGPAGSDAGIVNVSARRKIRVLTEAHSFPLLPSLFCVLLFRRLTSARAVQRLALHSAGTRYSPTTVSYSYTSSARPRHTHAPFPSSSEHRLGP
jgi:aldehyde dehydrogenase family 7 member A1